MKRFFALMALATMASSAADADSCHVEATPVNFGNYSPISTGPRDSTGRVSVTCNKSLTVVIGLSAGLHAGGSYSNRALSNGRFLLSYQFFTNAARSIVWGDGTGGTGVVQLKAPGSMTVYGMIPVGQAVGAGSYTDTVLVTVIF